MKHERFTLRLANKSSMVPLDNENRHLSLDRISGADWRVQVATQLVALEAFAASCHGYRGADITSLIPMAFTSFANSPPKIRSLSRSR